MPPQQGRFVITCAYQFKLRHTIIPGLVTVARFDGTHPSLACATTGGRIIIHSPHEKSLDPIGDPAIRFLNINKVVTALKAGPLVPGKEHDILFVGTEVNLLAYDVERNVDVFYKDVHDGVRCITFGRVSDTGAPLVIVGGHCSIQGFDYEGNECFWTVAGDTVGALALVEYSAPGTNHDLLAGSDDYAIRVFREEDVVAEVTEADCVKALCGMGKGGSFAYALTNGTIGVYSRTDRVWRVKSKHTCTCLMSFDLDANGLQGVITGWDNGAVSVRNMNTGEVVFKDVLPHGIAGIVASDYRMTGSTDVVVVTQGGDVKGYLAVPAEDAANQLEEDEKDRKVINELQQQKAELLLELKGLEDGLQAVKGAGGVAPASIPIITKVYAELVHNKVEHCCEVRLSTRNESVITNVALFDSEGGILDGECFFFSPSEPSPTCAVPLAPKKNQAGEVAIQVHVGGRSRTTTATTQLYVFEATLSIPRFAMFAPVNADIPEPPSCVSFTIKEQLSRICTWVKGCFLVPRSDDRGQDSSVVYNFIDMRRSGRGDSGRSPYLSIQARRKEGVHLQLRVDDMQVAGELVQDLCRYLGLEELESTAAFPDDMDRLRDTMGKVADYNAQRQRMTADMADVSQRAKTLIVKAEDARLLNAVEPMCRHYAELFKLNNELMADYMKRTNNHQALLDALKDVNLVIQTAANLRLGAAKTRVVTDCRAAIKSNNVLVLTQVITSGSAR